MNCRLDRLWPLAWLKSGAGPDRFGAVPMPFPWLRQRCRTQRRKQLPLWAQSDPSGSIWHPKTTPKSIKKVSPVPFFCKMANMRSARAGAVQTLFLLCNFEAISATMRVRRPFKIRAQNTYLKYVTFCVHWSCFGRPGYSQSVPWATILPACSALFAPFCHHLRHFLHDLGGWSLKSGSGVQF